MRQSKDSAAPFQLRTAQPKNPLQVERNQLLRRVADLAAEVERLRVENHRLRTDTPSDEPNEPCPNGPSGLYVAGGLMGIRGRF